MNDTATRRAPAFYRANEGGIKALYLLTLLSATNSGGLGIVSNVDARATVTSASIAGFHHTRETNWWSQLKSNLESLHRENPEWKISFSLANLVMLALTETNLKPDRIITSSDDGVSFYFFKKTGYALLQCLESREIVALQKEEDSGEQEVWEVPLDEAAIRDAILKIRAFTNDGLDEHPYFSSSVA